jgi:hypothetical protein
MEGIQGTAEGIVKTTMQYALGSTQAGMNDGVLLTTYFLLLIN